MEKDVRDKRHECVTTQLRREIEIADWRDYDKWHLNCTALFYQLQNMTSEKQEEEMAKHNEEPEYLSFHRVCIQYMSVMCVTHFNSFQDV
jgi:hypothetical protein